MEFVREGARMRGGLPGHLVGADLLVAIGRNEFESGEYYFIANRVEVGRFAYNQPAAGSNDVQGI